MDNREIFKVMEQHPPLSHEELAVSPTEKVILHNLRFAYQYAKQCADKYPGLSEDEIIEGMLYAATEAANRWDPNNSKFTYFMSFWIRNVIKDMSNSAGCAITRNPMYIWKSYKISEFVNEYRKTHDCDPSVEVIADATGFSKTTVYNVNNLGIKSMTSFSHVPNESDGGNDLNEIVPDHSAETPIEVLAKDDLTEMMDRLIDDLNPLEKQVIQMRWYYGIKYREIAERLEVPYSKVKRAEFDAMAKLKKELVAAERGNYSEFGS